LSAEKGFSIDTPAARFEPLLRDLYPNATFRHFATMTSGYNAPGKSRWNEPSEDWAQDPYEPAKPLFAPGSQFTYWDEAQMMFGRVLTQVAGQDLLTYMTDRVFSKIGIQPEKWITEGSLGGTPIRNGCTGLFLTALDLARFGQLFLNEGKWNGRQIVPSEWVREATTPQVAAGVVPADTDRRSDGRGRYGFNWWVNGRLPNGQLAMPDSPRRAYFSAGLKHNICLVVPEWEMVLVRLGDDSQPLGGHADTLNSMLRKLAPGVYPLE
jgi:CubicO group peptidase (beta-lactamase class C family)